MYVAKLKTDQGSVKSWNLVRESDNAILGVMIQNTSRQEYQISVFVYGPMGPDFGSQERDAAYFNDRDEALIWARKRIEAQPVLSVDYIDTLIKRVEDNWYLTQMSDDFAYTNGGYERYKRTMNNLLEHRRKLLHSD